MRRALVLSGGGSKGSWQVGACKHLIADKGYWFDVISGVSVGAVNGTTLAHAQDQEDLRSHLERLRCWWFGVSGNHNIYRRRRFSVFRLGRSGGLFDVTPLRDEVVARQIDPQQVAASPILLRIGYLDLRSARFRTACNDHPHLRHAVLASCALPLLFPPVRLPGSKEIGVDGGLRALIPLEGALRVVSDLPPDDEPPEIWAVLVQCPRKARLPVMVRKCLRSAFPKAAFSLQEERQQRSMRTFRIDSEVFKPHRFVRVRVLHPDANLGGSVLDFDPAKIQAWYEDGLRTARNTGSSIENRD